MNGDLQPQSTVFAAALQWIEVTAIGTVATGIAVIAVASVGFLLLSGRIDVRRGAEVILGCFILFGASSIAVGIMNAAATSAASGEVQPSPAPISPRVYSPAPHEPAPPVQAYDPYAGAALPVRR